jgi:hypothetical protein
MNGITIKARGYFLVVTGFLACPCHLPLTLPLMLALTAGTAFGAFLATNVVLIFGLFTIYFFGAIALGIHFLGQEEKMCEVPRSTAHPNTDREIIAHDP